MANGAAQWRVAPGAGNANRRASARALEHIARCWASLVFSGRKSERLNLLRRCDREVVMDWAAAGVAAGRLRYIPDLGRWLLLLNGEDVQHAAR
jgi:hypothetical protein